MEYLYTQNPDANKPVILVDKYIGRDSGGNMGIDGGIFAREVLALKNNGKTQVEVWINSKGGNISDGFNIYGTLKNSGLKVTTVNMGAVDSTAGWIYQAGDHRVWMNYGLGLVHPVQGAGKHVEAANMSVATMLASRSKKSVEEVIDMMNADTILDAKQAQEYGFCDEVRNCNDVLNFTNSSDVNEVTKFGEQQTQKLLPKKKSMEALNNLLGLTNDANEASQIAAINKIIEAKNAAEASVKEKDGQILTLTNSKAEVDGKLLVAENKLLEAENANKKAAAEALIKEHLGKKIVDSPENVEKWTNAAIADYAGTKALIDAINLNVKAPEVPKAERGSDAPIINAHEYMMRK